MFERSRTSQRKFSQTRGVRGKSLTGDRSQNDAQNHQEINMRRELPNPSPRF